MEGKKRTIYIYKQICMEEEVTSFSFFEDITGKAIKRITSEIKINFPNLRLEEGEYVAVLKDSYNETKTDRDVELAPFIGFNVINGELVFPEKKSD